ncbi:hypothetical protein B484DRAFT_394531, partial [Ochromonadaceae sp. CCMP2298]
MRGAVADKRSPSFEGDDDEASFVPPPFGAKVVAPVGSPQPRREVSYLGDTTRLVEVPKFPTAFLLSQKRYLYLRWIWVQYPWLALDAAPEVGWKEAEERHRYDGSEVANAKP